MVSLDFGGSLYDVSLEPVICTSNNSQVCGRRRGAPSWLWIWLRNLLPGAGVEDDMGSMDVSARF